MHLQRSNIQSLSHTAIQVVNYDEPLKQVLRRKGSQLRNKKGYRIIVQKGFQNHLNGYQDASESDT